MTPKTAKAKATSLRKLLTSRDAAVTRQGFELAMQLEDPAVFDELVAGATYVTDQLLPGEKYKKSIGRIVPNKAFTGANLRQHQLDYVFAWLVAASDHPLKEQVTALSLGHWGYKQAPLDMEFSWLAGFPSLERLDLPATPDMALPGLDEVGLKELHLTGYSRVLLGAHPSLRVITGAFEIEPGGSWPDLRSAKLTPGGGTAALGAGAPKLEELRVVAASDDVLEVVDFPSLKRLNLTGSCVVRRCPELAEAVFSPGNPSATSTGVDIAETPALKTLHLLHSLNPECDLSKLTSVTEVRFGERIGARRVSVPPNATLVPGPRSSGVAFWRVDDLGNIADLRPLTKLGITSGDELLSLAPLSAALDVRELSLAGPGITDLAPLASLRELRVINLGGCTSLTDLAPLALLPELRVIDLQGCKSVTDLTPIILTPMLQLVAIQDSGVVSPPAELGRIVSRDAARGFAKEIAAMTPKPRLAAADPQSTPATGVNSAAWDQVLHGLASDRLATKLEAVDLACTLGPEVVEELLTKVSVVKHRLRLRKPLRVGNPGDAPELVGRLLKAAPPGAKNAEKLRKMTALEVGGKYDGRYLFDNIDAFTSVEHLVISKGTDLALDLSAMANLHTLVVSARRIEQLLLPPSLKRLLLHRCWITDSMVAEISASSVEELALPDTMFDYRSGGQQPPEISPMPVRSLTIEVFMAPYVLSRLDWPQLEEIELTEQRGLGAHDFPALTQPFDFSGERIWVDSLDVVPEGTDPNLLALMAERKLRTKVSWPIPRE